MFPVAHSQLATLLLRLSHRLCLLLVLVPQLCLAVAAQGPAQVPPSAQTLLAMANVDRANRRLSPLWWDPALARAALLHAQVVAVSGQLEHQYPGEPGLLLRAANAGVPLSAIAENLLRGTPGSLAGVEQSWLASPIHRANLLNPEFNRVGIALLRARTGELIVVEDLGRAAAPTDLNATEQTLLRSLQALGLPEVGVSASAHATCQQHLASPTPEPPATIIQWDGPDPTVLPAALDTLLQQHTFHHAELGTCAGAESARGFSTTRVTLFLR